MAKKLFMSLEDDQSTPEVQPEETITVAENDAEAAVATVNEVVDDIKEDVETLEDAVEDIGELEAQTEVVEDTLEDGGEGMTEDHAKSVEIAVESIFKRLGVDPKKSKKLVSTEAFGSTHTRKQATQVTLEGFKETLVTLWKRIVEYTKQIWDKLLKFYEQYVSDTGRLKKGLEALYKQVKAANGSPKEAELKAFGLVKAFWDFNANEPKADEIIANHIAVTKSGLQFADGVTSVAEDILSVVKKGANEGESDVDTSGMGAIVEKSNKLLMSAIGGKEEAGPFFNGNLFKLETNGEGEAKLGAAGFGFVVNNKISEKGKDTIAALDKAGCEKVLAEAKELLSLTEKFKEKQAKVKAFQNAIDKIADTVISAVNKMADDGEGKKEGLTQARTFINKANITYTKVLSTVPGMNINVVKAAMNYVQASLRNMGEASAAQIEDKTKEE